MASEVFDPELRACDGQAPRDQDDAVLASGSKTCEPLETESACVVADDSANAEYDEHLFERRAAEKQASRDQDVADLASGRKTREQLWRENSMFAGLPVKIGKPDRLF